MCELYSASQIDEKSEVRKENVCYKWREEAFFSSWQQMSGVGCLWPIENRLLPKI